MSASDGDDDTNKPIITWADPDADAINEGNATAVEAISERLAEVTGLAEQLDMALRGAQEDCAIGTSSTTTVSPTIKKILDGTSGTGDLEWSSPSKAKNADEDADDEFVTASECTYPQSRSSSFNTNSEPGHFSPWWEFDQKGDINEDISKEKMVLAVGCPDLPPPKSVLKPSPEVPAGKIVHEVTETTHIKVQHCHTLGVSSFVLTSETVRDAKGEASARKDDAVKVEEGREVMIPVYVERDVDEDEFMRRMKEVGPPFEDKTAWSKYYHNYVTKQAIKGCI